MASATLPRRCAETRWRRGRHRRAGDLFLSPGARLAPLPDPPHKGEGGRQFHPPRPVGVGGWRGATVALGSYRVFRPRPSPRAQRDAGDETARAPQAHGPRLPARGQARRRASPVRRGPCFKRAGQADSPLAIWVPNRQRAGRTSTGRPPCRRERRGGRRGWPSALAVSRGGRSPVRWPSPLRPRMDIQSVLAARNSSRLTRLSTLVSMSARSGS